MNIKEDENEGIQNPQSTYLKLHLLFLSQSKRFSTAAPVNKCTCCSCLKATCSAQLHQSTNALAVLVSKQQVQHSCICQQVHLLFSSQSNRFSSCICSRFKATGSTQLHPSTSALAVFVLNKLKQQVQHSCTSAERQQHSTYITWDRHKGQQFRNTYSNY